MATNSIEIKVDDIVIARLEDGKVSYDLANLYEIRKVKALVDLLTDTCEKVTDRNIHTVLVTN